jgi:hypothetical protein
MTHAEWGNVDEPLGPRKPDEMFFDKHEKNK